MRLINDYSLIADLHIFVYERAEFSSISLECIKVKLLILDNFAFSHNSPTYENIYALINMESAPDEKNPGHATVYISKSFCKDRIYFSIDPFELLSY